MGLEFNNILAIGAHPDDIEYSCLGFLLNQKNAGVKILTYTASHGSREDFLKGSIRIKESAKSSEFNNFIFFLRESGKFDYGEIEKEIRIILNSEKVDCVLVHDPNDSHQEHRMLYDIVISAIRRLDLSVIRYKSVSSTNLFHSNLIVNVSDFMEFKFNALAFHESQKSKTYMSKNSIESFHRLYWPGKTTVEFYESFYIESILN
jgi:LmbE family N-acetylglucosaminyl deacetylase